MDLVLVSPPLLLHGYVVLWTLLYVITCLNQVDLVALNPQDEALRQSSRSLPPTALYLPSTLHCAEPETL